jgi:hypothetical protein
MHTYVLGGLVRGVVYPDMHLRLPSVLLVPSKWDTAASFLILSVMHSAPFVTYFTTLSVTRLYSVEEKRLGYYPRTSLQKLRRTTRSVRVSSVSAEIRTEHPPNESPELYRCGNPPCEGAHNFNIKQRTRYELF